MRSSWPVGATYVRLLTEFRPDLDALVVDAGPSSPILRGGRPQFPDTAQRQRARLLARPRPRPGGDAVPVDMHCRRPGDLPRRAGQLADANGRAGKLRRRAGRAVDMRGARATRHRAHPLHPRRRLAGFGFDRLPVAVADHAFGDSPVGAAMRGTLIDLFDPCCPWARGWRAPGRRAGESRRQGPTGRRGHGARGHRSTTRARTGWATTPASSRCATATPRSRAWTTCSSAATAQFCLPRRATRR